MLLMAAHSQAQLLFLFSRLHAPVKIKTKVYPIADPPGKSFMRFDRK